MNYLVQGTSAPEDDAAHIRKAVELLFQPGDLVELRAKDVPRRGPVSGYYDDLDRLAKDAFDLDRDAPAVYVVLNPVTPEVRARSYNQLKDHARVTTSDAEILRRRWILIDIDPVRPTGVSSTKEEHQRAFELVVPVADFLTDKIGIPEKALIWGSSGNGCHLLVRIELPNDNESRELLKRCLAALALQFNTERVIIDQSTFSAAQCCKLYGTMARKGDSLPERPHRRSRLDFDSNPGPFEIADRAMLEKLAAMAPSAPARSRSGPVDVDAFLQQHGLNVHRSASAGPGKHKWVLDTCPWDSSHTDQSAYVMQFPDGGVAAGCHHNSCAGKNWKDLREKFEPDQAGSDPDAAHAPRQFKLLSIHDLRQLRLPEQLVAGLIAAKSVCSLVGQSNQGKSFLALDLALCVATGQPFHGRPVKQGRVVYAAAEGKACLRKRVDAWCAFYHATPPIEFVDEHFDLGDKKVVEAFCAALTATRPFPSLVVIDPLSTYMTGDQDRASDIAKVNREGFLQIVEQTGAAVLVIVHAGWSKEKRERGSSALRGIMDTVMFVEAGKQDESYRRLITVEELKQKDLPPFGTFHLDLFPVNVTIDGETESSCVVTDADPKAVAAKTAPTLSRSATKALATLKTQYPNWLGFEEWRKASGLKKSTFKEARKALLDCGSVESDGHRYRYRAEAASGPAAVQPGPDGEVRPEDIEKDEVA